jgi:hypothetical protein
MPTLSFNFISFSRPDPVFKIKNGKCHGDAITTNTITILYLPITEMHLHLSMQQLCSSITLISRTRPHTLATLGSCAAHARDHFSTLMQPLNGVQVHTADHTSQMLAGCAAGSRWAAVCATSPKCTLRCAAGCTPGAQLQHAAL